MQSRTITSCNLLCRVWIQAILGCDIAIVWHLKRCVDLWFKVSLFFCSIENLMARRWLGVGVMIPCLYLSSISSLLAIRFLFSSNPLLPFLLLSTSLYYSAFLFLSFSLFSFSLFSLSIIQPYITQPYITQPYITQPYITQPFHYSALLLSDIYTSINTLYFHL